MSEPFDLSAFEAHVATIPPGQFSGALQALIDHKERLQAQPLVTAREDEIARAYHEAHPPQLDDESGHPVWTQPAGAHDAWPIDATVMHEGRQWQNISGVPNVWTPGDDGPVPTWAEIPSPDPGGDSEPEPGPAQWEPGADYAVGDQVTYDGVAYRVIQAHTSQRDWAPPAVGSLFAKV